MQASYDKVTLVMNAEEVTSIFTALVKALEYTIDTHWINHPDSFIKNENSRLNMLRVMAPFSYYEYQETIDALQKRLDELVKAKGE